MTALSVAGRCDSISALLGSVGIDVNGFTDWVDPSTSLLTNDTGLAAAFRPERIQLADIIEGSYVHLSKQDLLQLEGCTAAVGSEISGRLVTLILDYIQHDKRQQLHGSHQAVYLDPAAYRTIAQSSDDSVLDICFNHMHITQGSMLKAWNLQHPLQARSIVVMIEHDQSPHWTAGIIDQQAAIIWHLDFMDDPARHDACVQEMLRWTSSSYFMQHQSSGPRTWQIQHVAVPQPTNVQDSGIYALLFAAGGLVGMQPHWSPESFTAKEVFMIRQLLMAYIAAGFAAECAAGPSAMALERLHHLQQ